MLLKCHASEGGEPDRFLTRDLVFLARQSFCSHSDYTANIKSQEIAVTVTVAVTCKN